MKHIITNRRHGKQVFYGLNGHVKAASESLLMITAENYDIQIVPKGS
jgi:hypothetical protein